MCNQLPNALACYVVLHADLFECRQGAESDAKVLKDDRSVSFRARKSTNDFELILELVGRDFAPGKQVPEALRTNRRELRRMTCSALQHIIGGPSLDRC